MINILCFGDSNTYGMRPDGTGRFDFNIRYPGRLQNRLGKNYRIIEEGLPGRTTIFDDQTRPGRKAIDYLMPCIHSHTPLDWIILMLGTNDCKSDYGASSDDITQGLATVLIHAQGAAGPNTNILIVAPIHLGEEVWKPEFDLDFNKQSVVVSQELTGKFKQLASQTGCVYFDAASVAKASPIDHEHLDEAGHRVLADSLAHCLAR